MKHLRRSGIHPPPLQPGFSLVEVAIVLLIVSILLAGILMPLSIQREVRSYADTKRTMDEIKEALIGFALANGRLPCPADPALANGVLLAGVERTTCTAAGTNVGVIPWVTLNVPETDEWGGRFTYRVTVLFAEAIKASAGCTLPATRINASFALCDSGNMKIQSRTKDKVPPYDLTNLALPAVFISHGKNGYGAYRSIGGSPIAFPTVPPATDNPDERANATSTTTIFFSREITPVSSGCSDTTGATPMCEFDDLVAFVPLTTLMNRMVVSGKLP